MPDCVFCARIVARDFTAAGTQVVYFEPLDPVTPGHLLFVPRKHAASAAANSWLAGAVFEEAAYYGQQAGLPFNLITSVGPEATQTIPHLHVHYVPRRPGDGLALPWTGQKKRGPMSVAATMCPGCGQNRMVDQFGEFEPHHTAHNGVDGPLCTWQPQDAPWS